MNSMRIELLFVKSSSGQRSIPTNPTVLEVKKTKMRLSCNSSPLLRWCKALQHEGIVPSFPQIPDQKRNCMKSLNQIALLFFLSILALACSKSGSDPDPGPSGNQLPGTWHVDYYVAANIVVGLPDDTLYARHNEAWTFKEDSLFADSWLVAMYDLTTDPATFRITDTIETKTASSYTRNGNKIITRSAIRQETLDIITLTDNQLVLHETLDPLAGFTDEYISLSK